MPHIALPEGLPGISAGFAFRPETAKPMRELAHILLHEPSTLLAGERELIATYVSSRNCTQFCVASHGAAAASHLGDAAVVEAVKADFHTAPISAKLKALMEIAGKVQQDGKLVTSVDVHAARREGATDLEIHDTVLIAAAFSMYNRYVDGLGTIQPTDPDMYTQMASTWPSRATGRPWSGNRSVLVEHFNSLSLSMSFAGIQQTAAPDPPAKGASGHGPR